MDKTLCGKRTDVQRHVDSLYSSCEDGKQQPSIDLLCKTFQDMVQQVGEVWIVLDALDEYQTRKEYLAGGLLPWMEHLLGIQQTNVHLLITSRPKQDIKLAIENWARKQDIVPIQSDLVAEDIRVYVHTRVRMHQGLSRWRSRPEVQEEIEAALIEKANGMFRWVSCQLDVLENCLDYPTLRKALVSLPKTLDETYARILNSIPDEHKHHTSRILQFLTFSDRPLRIDEAIDALAVDVEHRPCFNPKNRMPDPEEISMCCSSLVVIITIQDSRSGEDRKEIQLAHFSVKEYLTSTRLEKDVAKDLEEAAARASIAKVCLAYLLELNASLSAKDIRQSFFLAQYSARYWTDHAIVGESHSETVRTLAKQFFSHKSFYETCYHLYNPDHPWKDEPEGHEELAPALYYASLGGLASSVRALLDNSADVNAQGGRYGNALQDASSGGHVQVVQMLLKKNADVNAQGGYYGDALQAASFGGRVQVVQMLLKKNADVNAQGGYYGDALQAASFGGHVQVVQILLEKNADVNAQGGEYGNALQAALERGHIRVAQELLDKGADGNKKGSLHKKTALHIAAEKGISEIVQLFLGNGVDYGTVDAYGEIALHYAAENGHLEIVKSLVYHGSQLNILDSHGRTPLECARRPLSGPFKGRSITVIVDWLGTYCYGAASTG